MVLVVDTGVLYGALDRDDPRQPDCAAVLEAHAGELVVPVPVIVEAAWLIESRIGPAAEAAFLRGVNAGEIERVDLTGADWDRVVELIDTYADLGLGTVDASVIAIAERLAVTTIATLNDRDFRVVHPAHCDAFTLLP